MMRPTKISSAAGYSEYLGREVYYQKGDGTPVDGIAFGDLAQSLGLEEGKPVSIGTVRDLMEGINPNMEGEAWSEKDRVLKSRFKNAIAEPDEKEAPEKAETAKTRDPGEAPDRDQEKAADKDTPATLLDLIDHTPDSAFVPAAPDGTEKVPETKEAYQNRYNLSDTDYAVLKETLDKIGIDHNAGYDLTFSVPKSLSLAIVRDGRHDLKEAVDAALDKTLAAVQRDLIEYRQRDEDGDLQRLQGNGAMMVKFMHEFSREGDADIHVHVFLANMTRNNEGEMVALESQSIYKNQDTLTAINYANLRQELAARKIDTIDHPTHPGAFELAGFSEAELQANSRASERMGAAVANFIALKGREPTGSERNDLLNRVNRPVKDDMSAQAKTTLVKERNEALGFGPKDYDAMTGVMSIRSEAGKLDRADQEHYRTRDGDRNEQTAMSLNDVVRSAVEVSTERDAVVHKYEIVGRAIKFGHSLYTQEQIEAAPAWKEAVVRADKTYPSYVTTHEHIQDETRLLDESLEMKRGGKAFDPQIVHGVLSDRKFLDEVMGEGKTPNPSQVAQVMSVLTSDHMQVQALGAPGTGKTKGVVNLMMNIVRKLEDEVPDLSTDTPSGPKLEAVLGLAPTHRAKAEMEEIGLKTETIASEVMRFQNARGNHAKLDEMRAIYENAIVVVDEGSMLSNKERLGLNEMQRQLGISKMVFMGDPNQHPSVNAGDSLALTMAVGIETTHNRHIMRQRDLQDAVAVLDLGDREVKPAMMALKGKVATVERQENEPIERTVAREIVSKWAADRASVPIMTTTNAMRGYINQEARQALRDQERIGQEDIHRQEVLYTLGMRESELLKVENFKIGSVMVFHSDPDFGKRRGDIRTNIKKDETYTVIGTDAKLNMVALRHEKTGIEGTVKIHEILTDEKKPRFNLFRRDHIDMAENDMMVFIRKNEKAASDGRTIQNGDIAFFRGIENDRLKFEDHAGREFDIPKDSHQLTRMQFGYGVTDYKMQGATGKEMYWGAPAKSAGAPTLTNLMIMSSRHTDGFKAVTDDYKVLARRMENVGANPNALQHVNAPIELTPGLAAACQLAVERGEATAFPVRTVSGQHKTVSLQATIHAIAPAGPGEAPHYILLKTDKGKLQRIDHADFLKGIAAAGFKEGEKIKYETKKVTTTKHRQEKDKADDPDKAKAREQKADEQPKRISARYYRITSLDDITKQYVPEVWREKNLSADRKNDIVMRDHEFDKKNIDLTMPPMSSITKIIEISGPKL